jgi:fatty acid desaturase
MTEGAEVLSTVDESYELGTDAYERTTVLPRIDKQTMRELSELKQWRAAWDIASEWGLIAATIYLAETYWNPFVYVLAVFVIGTRQHALGVLMHDGAHYRLFKNRRLNDWVTEIFLSWPISITMYGYRRNHFAHHRYLNTPQDPDWVRKNKLDEYVFPKTKARMSVIVLKYLAGLYAWRELKMALVDAKLAVDVPKHLKWARLGCYAMIVSLAVAFHFWQELLMYWIVPLLTSFVLMVYIRAVADHFGNFAGGSHESIYTQSRTTRVSWLEAFIFAPHGINYHIEHHFFPGVPYYNLGTLHELLKRDEHYSRQAHITDGYINGLLKECAVGALPSQA